MPKNSLITQGTIYAKCYDALRGVDFSSDHTQVNEHRFAYLCNMWKDYKSAQGNGVETIPGYRKLVANAGGKINGIHEFRYIENGVEKTDVYIHAGTSLRRWYNYPSMQGITDTRDYVLGYYTSNGNNRNFEIEVTDCYDVSYIKCNGMVYEKVGDNWPSQMRTWNAATQQYTLIFTWTTSANVDAGTHVTLGVKKYSETMPMVYAYMANHESISFSFNNYLYILDGTHFLKCAGNIITDVETNAYVPTIYINGIPSGVNATIGKEYEQRNMLSPLFKQTYVADGTTTDYQIAVPNLEDVKSIKVYGLECMDNRITSLSKMVSCIRASFPEYASGDINGSFKLELDYLTERWALATWDDTEQDWVTGSHTEVIGGEEITRYSYDPSDLGLATITPYVLAKPGFVKVNLSAFDDEFGSINGTYDLVYQGSGIWNVGENWDINLRTTGVITCSDETEAWFEDNDHNTLQLTKSNGSDVIDFRVVTENGVPKIVNVTESNVVSVDLETGIVKFTVPPARPEDTEQEAVLNDTNVRYYPEGYAGIEITAQKQVTSVNGIVVESVDIPNIIKACTMVCMFDGRVFLSGNPKYPNNVFWCGRNADTGLIDPSYWGLLNYVTDGVETIPIKAMLPVADTLAVIKGDTAQDGSVFYHTPYETGEDLIPITYPSKQGLAGTGCTGAAVNFFDDPVFVSKHGVEAIGQLSVRLERALEHRSTLIDAKLTNQDLTKAQLCEWEGYLVLSVDGKVFLADSRQAYEGAQGTKEYEWYYLEDIGAYADQYDEYRYASRLQWEEHEQTVSPKKISWCTHCNAPIDECTCSNSNNWVELPLEPATEVYFPSMGQAYDLSGTVANPPASTGASSMSVYATDVEAYTVYGTTETRTVHYVVRREENPVYTDEAQTYADPHAYLVEPTGAKIGGVFHPAIIFKSIGDLLLFGTDNGQVFCFNTDQRNEDGTIDAQWYTFNGRTIECGCATKMDNCGIPHLTKTTVKKSIVLKTKKFDDSAAKIKVRTNRNAFNQVARINSMALDFTKMDFRDFSFSAAEKDLFQIKEKERRWVEKQYYIYSDEYMKPFALYYLAYRYYIIGRYKNR
ncbi:MAG: hypothetical protein IJT60_05690 [Clostridia bacterium]|nr:hypothetical protein [Clostridia bacterium]